MAAHFIYRFFPENSTQTVHCWLKTNNSFERWDPCQKDSSINEKYKSFSTLQPEKNKQTLILLLFSSCQHIKINMHKHSTVDTILLQFVFKPSLKGLQKEGGMQMLKRRLCITRKQQRCCAPQLVLNVYCA